MHAFDPDHVSGGGWPPSDVHRTRNARPYLIAGHY
jgi:hypothetical protein